MSNQFLEAPYAALAEVYDQAGYADLAMDIAPRYIAYAQQTDWAGRRVLDVGCGTGQTTLWLSQERYRVIGVDNNPHMLAQARVNLNARQDELVHYPPDFQQMDIRELTSSMGAVDLVLAAGGVLNAIQNLRELETAFACVHNVLDDGRLFIFDIRTIRGLADVSGGTASVHDVVHYDNEDDLVITVRDSFSFETLSCTRRYIIWRRYNTGWQRQDEIHVERGYPTQAIIAMLERTGFRVAAMLDPDMQPFDVQHDPYGRVVFLAEKQAGS
ncbi:MAG: methyltransferase domain-containing protein [Anaerolineae bacterium]|nr:methyltransferase domain-containing protein [Anaerolineae bacterium]